MSRVEQMDGNLLHEQDCRGSASERCAHYASSAIETLTECIVTLILQTGNVRLQSCEKLMGPVMHEDVQIDRV